MPPPPSLWSQYNALHPWSSIPFEIDKTLLGSNWYKGVHESGARFPFIILSNNPAMKTGGPAFNQHQHSEWGCLLKYVYVCVCVYIHIHTCWAFLLAQMVKNPPAIKETWVWPLVGKIVNTPTYFLNDHQDTIVQAPAVHIPHLGLLLDKSDLLVKNWTWREASSRIMGGESCVETSEPLAGVQHKGQCLRSFSSLKLSKTISFTHKDVGIRITAKALERKSWTPPIEAVKYVCWNTIQLLKILLPPTFIDIRCPRYHLESKAGSNPTWVLYACMCV